MKIINKQTKETFESDKPVTRNFKNEITNEELLRAINQYGYETFSTVDETVPTETVKTVSHNQTVNGTITTVAESTTPVKRPRGRRKKNG